MAKQPATASKPSPAPASPAVESSAPAGGTATQPKSKVEMTELQQDVDAFGAFFETLAGDAPSQDTEASKTKSKPAPEPKAIRKAKAEVQEDESDDSETKPEAAEAEDDDDEETGSILDEAEDEEDEEPKEGDDDAAKAVKGLRDDNYKLRAAKRELKAELAKRDAELAELAKKLETATVAPQASTPEVGGAYANVEKPADVEGVRAWLKERAEMIEDALEDGEPEIELPFGEDKRTLTTKDARKHLRWLNAEMARAADVRTALQQHEERVAKSKEIAEKMYPFVTNPKSRFNSVVLDMAKEFPEVARSPAKARLLGMLTVAKLIETGEYKAVPKVKPSSKPAPAPAASSTPSSAQAAPRAAPEEVEERGPTARASKLINGDRHAMAALMESIL